MAKKIQVVTFDIKVVYGAIKPITQLQVSYQTSENTCQLKSIEMLINHPIKLSASLISNMQTKQTNFIK